MSVPSADSVGIITMILGLLAVVVALWTHFKSDVFISRTLTVVFGASAVVLLAIAVTAFSRASQPETTPQAESSAPAQTLNTATSRASPSASAAAVPPVTAEAKLHFTDPKPNAVVCKVESVRLEGAVDPGKTLWIVVQSSGQYYLQGRAGEQGVAKSVWTLAGVNFGSTDPQDNGPYTILGVQASPETDSQFEQILNATHGDTGVKDLPGGVGVDPAEVPVNRQC